jgi:drug/metabolite transporter (DMT)-like permease
MFWVFFTLIAAFGYAAIGTAEKIVLTGYVKNLFSYLLLAALFQLLFSALVLTLEPLASIPPETMAFGFLAGLFWLAGYVTYFKAYSVGGEVTRIIPLVSTAPILVLFMAFLFLGEVPSGTQIAGIVITVAGASMLSIESYKKFSLEKGVAFVLVSALTWSMASVVERHVLLQGVSVLNA